MTIRISRVVVALALAATTAACDGDGDEREQLSPACELFPIDEAESFLDMELRADPAAGRDECIYVLPGGGIHPTMAIRLDIEREPDAMAEWDQYATSPEPGTTVERISGLGDAASEFQGDEAWEHSVVAGSGGIVYYLGLGPPSASASLVQAMHGVLIRAQRQR